jgi:hypothetical protein
MRAGAPGGWFRSHGGPSAGRARVGRGPTVASSFKSYKRSFRRRQFILHILENRLEPPRPGHLG